MLVYVVGGGLDIFGLMGMLMLIGLSAKNAILYLDFVVERIGKMPFKDALIEAAQLRFRPDRHDDADGARDQLPADLRTGPGLGVRPAHGHRHARRHRVLGRPHLLRGARRLLPASSGGAWRRRSRRPKRWTGWHWSRRATAESRAARKPASLPPGMHDYHVHTHYCRHATGTLEEYARAAVRRGLTEICFTPHIPLPVYRPGSYGGRLRMDPPEFPRFMEEIERVRPRVPGLTILPGVEADYVEGAEEYLERFLASWPLDLVLMSIHFVRKSQDPRWVFDLSGDSRPLARIYDDYLEAVEIRRPIRPVRLRGAPGPHQAARAHRSPTPTRNRSTRSSACAGRPGMSAEVNMSGARKAIGEPYPSWSVVRRMASAGLPLVPGSDAHAPDLVGSGLDQLQGLPLVRYRGRRIMDSRLDALPAAGA